MSFVWSRKECEESTCIVRILICMMFSSHSVRDIAMLHGRERDRLHFGGRDITISARTACVFGWALFGRYGSLCGGAARYVMLVLAR